MGSLFAWREEKDSITSPVIEAFAQPELVPSQSPASPVFGARDPFLCIMCAVDRTLRSPLEFSALVLSAAPPPSRSLANRIPYPKKTLYDCPGAVH